MQQSSLEKTNHHCTVIEIEGFGGILIKGESKSGKSSLALGLLEKFENTDTKATLVSDDQALLHVYNGNLIAEAPNSIAGKIEVHGFGICETDFTSPSNIRLIVSIELDEVIERMPIDETKELMGIALPFIKVPMRHEKQSARIICAWLKKYGEHK